MREASSVHVGEMRSAYKMLVGKPEGGVRRCGFSSSHEGYGRVRGTFELSNEPSGP
jgi:hypothetical protein